MARKLYYKIIADGRNQLTQTEWEGVQRLQHWYNSEFIWTAGKLNFKRYVIFPNVDMSDESEENLWEMIKERKNILQSIGWSEPDIIDQLELEGLVVVKRGGYFDNCLASGFTRVAANEWNAYLVCEFLLKVSRISRNASIYVFDEGSFIKPKNIRFFNGSVFLKITDIRHQTYRDALIRHRHVFSIVDPTKYDQFPVYLSTIANFNDLDKAERRGIVQNWNWLGFESNFDLNGDDVRGLDLNKKVENFKMEETV